MSSHNQKARLIEIAEKYNLTDFIENLSSIRKEKIKIKVAFLGEFSSGKSTLINALLKRKILPMFEEPTTAVITEISKGPADRFYEIRPGEDGEDVLQEISIGELSEAVSSAEAGKRVIIELKDAPILENDVLIIDTPGVSSIDSTHDDVTFGYLPIVDVAFVVMNINTGAPTETLISFLKQFPRKFLAKIYFILNFADTINPSKHEKLQLSFSSGLCRAMDNPAVLTISALEALESNSTTETTVSGINDLSPIDRIITSEVPQIKNTAREKRMQELIKREAAVLVELLQLKFDALTWETPQLDQKISLLKKEVAEIDADIDRYQRQFRDIREQCMLKVTNTIDDYIGGLAVKITKEQPIDNLVKAMVNDVKLLLETHIAKIKSLELTSLNCDTSEVIQAAIEKEASQIKGIADLTTDMATFALTLVLVFPVGAAAAGTTAAAAGTTAAAAGTTAAATATGATAAQMAARSSKAVGAVAKVSKFGKAAQALGNTAADTAGKAGKNTAKGGKYLKVLGKIGSVVKELNPLEKVKDVILPYFLNPRLSKLLGPKMAARLDLVFSEFELAINDEIDRQYLQPRRLKKELLTREYSNKAGARKSIDETRRSLEDDITEINRLLN